VETAAAAAHASATSSAVASMVYDNPAFQRGNYLEQEDRDQEIYDTSSVTAFHPNGLETSSGASGGKNSSKTNRTS
jgi:hypothetical protein